MFIKDPPPPDPQGESLKTKSLPHKGGEEMFEFSLLIQAPPHEKKESKQIYL